jgi:hypothetical protein
MDAQELIDTTTDSADGQPDLGIDVTELPPEEEAVPSPPSPAATTPDEEDVTPLLHQLSGRLSMAGVVVLIASVGLCITAITVSNLFLMQLSVGCLGLGTGFLFSGAVLKDVLTNN